MASAVVTPGATPTSKRASNSRNHRCPKCGRSFKRIEHMRRHERGHEEKNNFTCSFCSKTFKRSDTRNRHESMHKASEQSQQSRAKRTRACCECAKVRERCNRARPCLRCSSRSLPCTYPDETLTQGRCDTSAVKPSQLALAAPHGQDCTISPAPVSQNSAFSAPFLSGMQDSSSSLTQPDLGLEFPINWLPTDYNMELDYNSLLGLDMTTPGSLPAPNYGTIFGSVNSPSSLQLVASPHDRGQHCSPSQQASPFESSIITAGQSLDLPVLSNSGAHRDGQYEDKLVPFSGAGTSPAATVSTATRISTESNVRHSSRGGLYATSTTGARIPCTVRSKITQPTILGSTPLAPISSDTATCVDDDQADFAFPENLSRLSCPMPADGSCLQRMDTETYDTIASYFKRLCLNNDSIYHSYTHNEFPNIDHFNLFARLYFDHFDPILPIYNSKVADLNQHWILALAISSIGSQYTETQEFSRCVIPLHEFLRRAVAAEYETGNHSLRDLPLVQSMVLNQVGMMYYGSQRLQALATTRRSLLIDAVNALELLGLDPPIRAQVLFDNENDSSMSSLEFRWRQWLTQEAKHRLGYAIWLLDCMATYHFELTPLLSVEPAQCELPHDELWAAQSVGEWYRLFENHGRNPTLASAVQTLFVERKVQADLGEYSNLLLLHGIYQELFKVRDYFERPLSAWVPSVQLTATSEEGEATGLDSRRHTTLVGWQSAAMDCADVLHWSANSVVAQLSGAEHATVFHLQFSRVLLCSPYETVQELANYLALLDQQTKEKASVVMEKAMQAENRLLHWAQRDEHKARLAVLHCGSLFWHARRYSCKAYYEPLSVFLATLVLWAYSLYASRTPLQRHPAVDEDDSDGTLPDPSFMHLDRPVDDEIVQFFVRSGRPSVIRPYISGVGNIYDLEGPGKILREGRKLLVSISMAWGRTARYVRLLKAVEKYTLDRRIRDRNTSGDR